MLSVSSMSSTGRGAGNLHQGDGLADIDYIDDVDNPSPQGARGAFGQSVRGGAASGEAALRAAKLPLIQNGARW